MMILETSDFDAAMRIVNSLLPDGKLYGGVDTIDRRIIRLDCLAKTKKLIRKQLTEGNIPWSLSQDGVCK